MLVIKLPEQLSSSLSSSAVPIHISKLSNSAHTSPSLTNATIQKRKKASAKNFIPPTAAAPSSRTSIQLFPIISGLVESKQEPQFEYDSLKNGSIPSINSSSYSIDKGWTPPPPNHKEDLYSWMAKQTNGTSTNELEKDKISIVNPSVSPVRQAAVQPINSYLQEPLRILDAHLIFEPMLTCLGVMPQQMINNLANTDVSSLDSLGTNLSLVGSFDVMRIDIVVSEVTNNNFTDGKKTKTKITANTNASNNKKMGNGKYTLNIPNESPAFLCERVGVELEVLKVTDGFTDDTKHNILYLSRGQLKKHTSTIINFSLNVRYISQQVNMPLLRLLHQITNMYQNVKEAQNELREQPDVHKRSQPMKDESSLASEINDQTLLGSIHEPLMPQMELDERYDKFNAIPLGHSISR